MYEIESSILQLPNTDIHSSWALIQCQNETQTCTIPSCAFLWKTYLECGLREGQNLLKCPLSTSFRGGQLLKENVLSGIQMLYAVWSVCRETMGRIFIRAYQVPFTFNVLLVTWSYSLSCLFSSCTDHRSVFGLSKNINRRLKMLSWAVNGLWDYGNMNGSALYFNKTLWR